MKRHEVLQLEANLQSGGLDQLRGTKFIYALAKNMQKLQSEAESIRKAGEPSKDYKEIYDKARIEINEKYAQKNADGSPKMERRGNFFAYVIEEGSEEEYRGELTSLNKKHEALLDVRKAEAKEYDEIFLEWESDFTPHLVDEKDLPADITWGQRKLIILLIKSDEPEKPKKQKGKTE